MLEPTNQLTMTAGRWLRVVDYLWLDEHKVLSRWIGKRIQGATESHETVTIQMGPGQYELVMKYMGEGQ